VTTTTIHVILEIDGDPEEAYDVVEGLLDNGVFQDPINDYHSEVRGSGALHVKSAIARTFESQPAIEVAQKVLKRERELAKKRSKS
jgi:hypothetical protein